MFRAAMKLPDDVREFFSKQGKIGAAKRHASLTPERRREIARQAIATRWAKAKPVLKSTKNTTGTGTTSAVPKTTKKSKRSGGTK